MRTEELIDASRQEETTTSQEEEPVASQQEESAASKLPKASVHKLSREELFELIREQIKHEDELVNHRQNWLLISQGFLFVLFTSILAVPTIGALEKNWILFFIAAVGIALDALFFMGILEAFKSLKRLRETWYSPYSSEEEFQKHNDEGFPQITWVGTHGALHTATGTSMLITIVWGAMFFVVFQGSILLLATVILAVLFVVAYMVRSVIRL